jgi:hypothetical protein
LVPIPKRSTSPRGDIDTVVIDSLKALDLERPIREADIAHSGNERGRKNRAASPMFVITLRV